MTRTERNEALQESALLLKLKEDKELEKTPDKRKLFLAYANLFEQELSANLGLKSVELDAKYGTFNPQSWLHFLNYPIVHKYVSEFFDEAAEKQAQLALSAPVDKGSTAAIKVRDSIEERRKGNDNGTIVVMFMPQREYAKKV